jgi:hypothetical protein
MVPGMWELVLIHEWRWRLFLGLGQWFFAQLLTHTTASFSSGQSLPHSALDWDGWDTAANFRPGKELNSATVPHHVSAFPCCGHACHSEPVVTLFRYMSLRRERTLAPGKVCLNSQEGCQVLCVPVQLGVEPDRATQAAIKRQL